MRGYYRFPGSNFGVSAGFGELGFWAFLVFFGFLPFYAIYLALKLVAWVLIILIYALVILAAYIHIWRKGYPPTWELHNYGPDLLDHWLDRNNIVKIPR